MGLIRLCLFLFNITENKNQFIYTVIGVEGENPQVDDSSDISISKNCPAALISDLTPGSYEVSEIPEIIKEETYGNVIIEADKNTMKCKMQVIQCVFSFDLYNSIASLLGFNI